MAHIFASPGARCFEPNMTPLTHEQIATSFFGGGLAANSIQSKPPIALVYLFNIYNIERDETGLPRIRNPDKLGTLIHSSRVLARCWPGLPAPPPGPARIQKKGVYIPKLTDLRCLQRERPRARLHVNDLQLLLFPDALLNSH